MTLQPTFHQHCCKFCETSILVSLRNFLEGKRRVDSLREQDLATQPLSLTSSAMVLSPPVMKVHRTLRVTKSVPPKCDLFGSQNRHMFMNCIVLYSIVGIISLMSVHLL